MTGWLAKKILSAASAATELADKRSWRTLPDKIIMMRLPLSGGEHSINLKFYGRNNELISEKELKNITVKPGKKSFLILRTAG